MFILANNIAILSVIFYISILSNLIALVVFTEYKNLVLKTLNLNISGYIITNNILTI